MTTSIVEKFQAIEAALAKGFFERTEEIRGLNVGLVSGANILLLGPPGVGKSYLVNAWAGHLLEKGDDNGYFQWLLTKFSTPDELLGNISLQGIRENKYTRNMKGKLPEAKVAFIDETFKGNSGVLNALLAIANERVVFDDGRAIKIPLLLMVGASNEIPEESDGLDALFDRFVMKYTVKPIQERGNFARMLQFGHYGPAQLITLDEIEIARKEASEVTFSLEMVETFSNIREKLKTDGLSSTDRTYNMSVNILKAHAYLEGRDEVTHEDFDVLQHVLWSDPDNKKKIYTSILDLINPMKNKILELVDDAQTVFEQTMNLPDPAERLKMGVEALAKLKASKKKLHEYKTMLKNEGKDLKSIQKMEDKLDEWLRGIYDHAVGVPGFS